MAYIKHRKEFRAIIALLFNFFDTNRDKLLENVEEVDFTIAGNAIIYFKSYGVMGEKFDETAIEEIKSILKTFESNIFIVMNRSRLITNLIGEYALREVIEEAGRTMMVTFHTDGTAFHYYKLVE